MFYKTSLRQRSVQAQRRAIPGYKEKQAEYYRQWYRDGGRNRAGDYAQKQTEYRKQHRLEGNVRQRFQNYINSGIIVRSEYCSLCGRYARIIPHHLDYDKPFEVIWCCYSCHKRIHLGEDLNEQGHRVCYVMKRQGVCGHPTVFSIC